MKIFIAAMGSGEIGQGASFAKYAIEQGADVSFAIFNKNYLPFLDFGDDKLRAIVVDSSVDGLNQAIVEDNPDILVLCNSKILEHLGYYDNPPFPKPPTLSIDSNWLFSPVSPWKSMPWADTYCINLPNEVFSLGLKENGGSYEIPESVMKKIKVVGLVPSYPKISDTTKASVRKKYGVLDNEKLIFMYASLTSLSAVQQLRIYNKAVESVKSMRLKGNSIKVICIGAMPQSIADLSLDWLINVDSISGLGFNEILSSSDLVFQHQGLGTLEQAISANVPAIASVKDLDDEDYPNRHAHEWEVSPFARFGACYMMHFSDPLSESVEKIERLLYDDDAISTMKSLQRRIYSPGEEVVFIEAKRLIEQKKSNLL